jgi:hypothetical protein
MVFDRAGSGEGLRDASELRLCVTCEVYHRPLRGQNVLRLLMRTVLGGVVLLPSLLTLGGCGRRATAADCQLIVDKSVELQMREMSHGDVLSIEKREKEVRGELESEMKSCEGRNVTEHMLSCVRSANTRQALDECLR